MAVPALNAASVDCAGLANNHVLDYEEVALRDTLNEPDEAGVAHSGAGRTLDEALEPAVVSIGGVTVAVVAFTDNTPEFEARGESSGTARIEVDTGDDRALELTDEALTRAREHDPDLIVASFHWGPNMIEEPPESFREFGRWLVDRGVDTVHGHSAHVFQGVEIHDGAPIIYDAGDFVDAYAVDDDRRNDRSFVFEVRIEPESGDPVELRSTPLRSRTAK